MADDASPPRRFAGRQRQMAAALFIGISAALALGYWLFLRVDYAVLYTGLKPADAAAIIAELDAKGVAHRLRDDGGTIMVPAADADGVRVAVAGSDIPMKGAVGFELFNKSDMGLTDFAQKINYQRALQGELARTIMMMDGVETARVHVAIPERSLFRGSDSVPKAAVEVIARIDRPLTRARIAGIQQLVAASVSDLPLGEVTVLDGDGRVVSAVLPAAADTNPDADERSAVQNYYAARARAALATHLPGVRFDVHALAIKPTVASDAMQPMPIAAAPGSRARDFQLRLTVVSAGALPADDEAEARSAMADAVDLDERRGDEIRFEVGPTPRPMPPDRVLAMDAAVHPEFAGERQRTVTTAPESPIRSLALRLLAGAAVLSVIVLSLRGRKPALADGERDAFVDRLRVQLGSEAADVRP